MTTRCRRASTRRRRAPAVPASCPGAPTGSRSRPTAISAACWRCTTPTIRAGSPRSTALACRSCAPTCCSAVWKYPLAVTAWCSALRHLRSITCVRRSAKSGTGDAAPGVGRPERPASAQCAPFGARNILPLQNVGIGPTSASLGRSRHFKDHSWPAATRNVQGDSIMKVMVIVKATKASEAGQMPSQQLLTEMGKFNEELVKAGIMLEGEGLQPSSKGARVRFAGKSRMVIDGPFAETKELIAGFWLWKVSSFQEAIDWVKRCPNPHEEECEVEIRPVFQIEDFGDAATPEVREREARLRAQVERNKRG